MSDSNGVNRAVAKKHKAPVELLDEDYSMKVYDYKVYTKNTGATKTITLPPVAEAAYLGPYVIYLRSQTAAYKAIVEDNNGDAGLSDFDLDADDDYAVIWSDGEKWFVLKDGYT